MFTVSQVLARKGYVVHTIDPGCTVFEAIGLMVGLNIGSLIVVDRAVPCGIVTERDYLRKVALLGRASKTTFVHEVMSSPVVYVEPDTVVDTCMLVMTRGRLRHLPVISDGQLAGVVSIGDIIKFVAEERMSQIYELTAYIQGVQKWRTADSRAA